MNVKMLFLLVSCFVASHMNASSASSQNVQLDREAALKKALEPYTTGKMPTTCGVGQDVASMLKKEEEEIIQAHIAAAQNPHDKEAQNRSNISTAVYMNRIEEIAMKVPMNRLNPVSEQSCLTRLLLKNALLEHKLQETQAKLAEYEPGKKNN